MTADPPFSRATGRRRGSIRQGSFLLLLLVVVPAAAAVVQGFDQTSTPSPPIILAAGQDLAAAQGRGLVTQERGHGAAGEIDLQLHVPLGTQVTIDRLLEVHAADEVDRYEMALRPASQAIDADDAAAIGVTVRLWTGQVAPQADDASQVCQVLRSGDPAVQGSGTCGTAEAHVQLIVEVPEGQDAPAPLHLVTTATLTR